MENKWVKCGVVMQELKEVKSEEWRRNGWNLMW